MVGSYASSTYGEARFTQDIDFVIGLTEPRVREFVSWFPDSDFYISAEAVRDAVRNHFHFNILHPASANKLDFALPQNNEWGRGQLGRRRRMTVAGLDIDLAAPEDVIIGKPRFFAEGASDKQLRDVAGILRRQKTALDRDYLDHWLREFGVEEAWAAVVAKESGSPETT